MCLPDEHHPVGYISWSMAEPQREGCPATCIHPRDTGRQLPDGGPAGLDGWQQPFKQLSGCIYCWAVLTAIPLTRQNRITIRITSCHVFIDTRHLLVIPQYVTTCTPVLHSYADIVLSWCISFDWPNQDLFFLITFMKLVQHEFNSHLTKNYILYSVSYRFPPCVKCQLFCRQQRVLTPPPSDLGTRQHTTHTLWHWHTRNHQFE